MKNPEPFKPRSIEEVFSKEFAPRSKRFKSRPVEVQKRVARILAFKSEKTVKAVKAIKAQSNQLDVLVLELAKKQGKYSNLVVRADTYKKALRTRDWLLREIDAQLKIIELAQKLGQKTFDPFRPAEDGYYKHTTIERKFHMSWKSLLDQKDYVKNLSELLKEYS